MAEPQAALGPDDYKALHALVTSSNEAERADGLKLAKKLTPAESQAFFEVQKEANREKTGERIDRNIVGTESGAGVSPEDLLIGGTIAKGVYGAAKAGGAVAGVKAAVGSAAPIIKYEATRSLLVNMGVPNSLATIAAMTVAGYNGKGKTPAAPAEPSAPPADAPHLDRSVPVKAGDLTPQQLKERILQGTGTPAPKPPRPPHGTVSVGEILEGPPPAPARAAPAVPSPAVVPAPPPATDMAGQPAITARPPAGNPTLPDQKALNEAAIAQRRAAYQARQAAEGASLTPAETPEYTRLIRAGKSHQDALALIKVQRSIAKSMGLPTADEAAAATAERAAVSKARRTGGNLPPEPAPTPGEVDAAPKAPKRTRTKSVGELAGDVPEDADISFPKVPGPESAPTALPAAELHPDHAGELRRIVHELDAMPYTPRLLKSSGVGSTLEHVEGTGGAGAKVYDDVLQMAPGTAQITRGTMQRQIEEYLAGGRITNAVRGALEIAKLRLEGKMRIPQDGTLSRPELPPSARDVPTRLEKP